MSEAATDPDVRVYDRSGRAWPERPGPQGQERETVSEAATDPDVRVYDRSGRAWPERPGPQGQERET